MNKTFKANQILSPWSKPVDPEVKFPIKDLEQLLNELGWPNPIDWYTHWLKRGGVRLASSYWPNSTRSDWVWGLGLPLLTEVERFLINKKKRVILGISGLPGCGKTSLARWLKEAASKLSISLEILSIDDF